MSRIIKNKIKIPSEIICTMSNDSLLIDCKSKSLSKLIDIDNGIDVKIENSEILFEVKSKMDRIANTLVGTTYRNVKSAISAISNGFSIELKYFGVGFKAELIDNGLFLYVGLSHPVYVLIPVDVKVELPSQGLIKLTGFDNEKVSDFAAYLKSIKKVEPYKGKGIYLSTDFVRRKEAKTGKK